MPRVGASSTAVLCLLALAAAGLAGGGALRGPAPCGRPWRALPYYAPTSPLNQPIPADAEADPGSAEMVQGLVRAGLDKHFVLALKRFTVPVYFTGPGTSSSNVRLTASWAPRRTLANVPIPLNARPDPGGDGHMVILVRATGCEYDFWQARRRADGTWTASWGDRTSVSGPGIFRRGIAARASGFALLAGLIFPAELRRGQIDHALSIGYPHTRAGGPVPPATGSDGRSTGPEAIPEGARLQLDPALDLSTLRLTRYEQVIGRALQVYGAFVTDTAGAVSLGAAHPQSYEENPYADLLPDVSYVRLDGIPLDRFRVLELPRS